MSKYRVSNKGYQTVNINDNTTFLEDALQHAGREARHRVADSLACHLHNTGYCLEGNTEANDVEWLARGIAQSERGDVPGQWQTYHDETKEHYMRTARAVLRVLPQFQMRIAHRLIELSKVVRDIERAERQQRKAAEP